MNIDISLFRELYNVAVMQDKQDEANAILNKALDLLEDLLEERK